MLVILMGLLVIAMVAGKEFSGLKGTAFGVAVVIIIVAVALAVGLPEGAGGISLSERDRSVLLNIGIPLGIFLIAIAIVTAKPKQGDKGIGRFFEKLGREFGGS